MKLSQNQKEVISNIFRDLTKLTVVALVLGQFVPEQQFNLLRFFGGITSAILMAVVAVIFAPNKEDDD